MTQDNDHDKALVPAETRLAMTGSLGDDQLLAVANAAEAVFNVHGLLTFSGRSSAEQPYPVPTAEPTWWFGFHAAHCYDTEEGGRSLAYMLRQAEHLPADQEPS